MQSQLWSNTHKKLQEIFIEYTCISESMLCLHWGKSVNVKWIKKKCFLIFSKAVTDMKKRPVLGLDIFSTHHWVTIFKFVIESLILELWNYMFNPSATVIVLFDSSPTPWDMLILRCLCYIFFLTNLTKVAELLFLDLWFSIIVCHLSKLYPILRVPIN